MIGFAAKWRFEDDNLSYTKRYVQKDSMCRIVVMLVQLVCGHYLHDLRFSVLLR
jgi:hypothetical protein